MTNHRRNMRATSDEAPAAVDRFRPWLLAGMMALNQLPRLHHPLLKKARFALASRDKFIIVIGSNDPKFGVADTKKWLENLGGAHVEIVEDED